MAGAEGGRAVLACVGGGAGDIPHGWLDSVPPAGTVRALPGPGDSEGLGKTFPQPRVSVSPAGARKAAQGTGQLTS